MDKGTITKILICCIIGGIVFYFWGCNGKKARETRGKN